MIAVGFDKYGSEEALARDAIKHLYDVYVKINADAKDDESVHDAARAYFKRMEDGEIVVIVVVLLAQSRLGDETALANWRRWRDLSIEKYKEEYARLNIAFDVYSGESQVCSKLSTSLSVRCLQLLGRCRRSTRCYQQAERAGACIGVQRCSSH
jgi:arginyl-tRNA synthetase